MPYQGRYFRTFSLKNCCKVSITKDYYNIKKLAMTYQHETPKATWERELGGAFKRCAHIRLLRKLSTCTFEGHLRHLYIWRALENLRYLDN